MYYTRHECLNDKKYVHNFFLMYFFKAERLDFLFNRINN